MGESERDAEERKTAADKQALTEGNQCIALGLGVGGLSAAAAIVLGATCPLCLLVAPGLVGTGLLKRRSTRQGKAELEVAPNNLSSVEE